ncbi:MAG TPA: PKD domain-containing protein [Blastocatellia bacterium]
MNLTRVSTSFPARFILTLAIVFFGCARHSPRAHVAASGASQYTISLTPILNGDIGTNENPDYATAHSAADCTDCSSDAMMTAETSVGVIDGIPEYSVIRGLMDFDTSSLGPDAVITSASLSVVSAGSHIDYSTNDFIRLVTNDIESTTSFGVGDFNSFSTTAQAQDIPVESLATNTATTFYVDTEGLASISTTSVTRFGVRTGADVEDRTPVPGTDPEPAFALKGGTVVFFYSAANGPSLAPRLTITYTLPGSAVPPHPPTPTPTPTPGFEVTIQDAPLSGEAPLTVSLKYESTNGTPMSEVWELNGADVTTGPSFTTTFLTAGTYQVSVDVTDMQGNVAQATATIRVTSPPARGQGNN